MIIRLPALTLVLTLTACGTLGGGYDDRNNNRYRDSYTYADRSSDPRHRQCLDCGTVTRISRNRDQRDDSTSGGGVVAGAVIGGVLGNQIGGGSGRTAATVAGAVAGGVAGNAIERNAAGSGYVLTVRMDRGDELWFTQHALDGIREGTRVRVRDDRLWLD
jgi:outer membrane lipoprotein SlyB